MHHHPTMVRNMTNDERLSLGYPAFPARECKHDNGYQVSYSVPDENLMQTADRAQATVFTWSMLHSAEDHYTLIRKEQL